jgi:hypothetical protein
MIIETRQSANGKKIYYRFKWGQGYRDRMSAGIFTYMKSKNQVPAHRYKSNFLDFYQEFVKKKVRQGKRHLATSFVHFKRFIAEKSLPPIEITEELCTRFRNYVLDKFNGDTPMNYYSLSAFRFYRPHRETVKGI